MKGNILVTGGASYIGSHTVVQLLEAGFSVVVFDNLSNSSRAVIDRITKLTGKHLEFVEGDIRDRTATCFDNSISAVIHFAGLKAVGESELSRLNITIITYLEAWCYLRKWPSKVFRLSYFPSLLLFMAILGTVSIAKIRHWHP